MPAPRERSEAPRRVGTSRAAAIETAPPPARVEAILAGAAVAFSRSGFAATSMRQIARQTDTSLGAIYYHFDSKESILHAIITTNFQRVQESLDKKLEGVGDPRLALEAFVANHIDFFGRHLHEMRVMAHELDTLSGVAGDDVAALRRAYTERAREILEALRPDLSSDELRVAVLCLFGALNWTYRWFHTIESSLAPDRLAARMSAMYLDGFLDAGGGRT